MSLPARARFRLYGARFLLMITPVVLVLVVAEVTLRARVRPKVGTEIQAESHQPGLTSEKSAELGWIFPADTTGVFRSSGRLTDLTTNAWGLRGPAVTTDSLTQRVLVLGDSYAFGWGVADQDGFVRVLESELRQKFPDVPLECINGALPGYSIYQQVRMLAYVRQRTRVAAVVATISLANDMVDEIRIRRFAPDHLADFSYELRPVDSLASRLIGTSRALAWLDGRTTYLQFSLVNTTGKGRRLAAESLTDLARACREANLPLVWVLVPRKKEILGGGLAQRALNRATDKTRGQMLDLAADLAVPILDLKPVLLAVQTSTEVYLPGDAHWDKTGHRAVAAEVLPLLLSRWTPR